MGLNIIHVGAFDIENFGDLLFPVVFKIYLNEYIENIYYFAPNKCTMPNTDIQVNSIKELDEFCRTNKVDSIIVGGGDLAHLRKVPMFIPQVSDDWITYEPLNLWMTSSMVSKKYNIPLVWNAPGCPIPFSKEEAKIVSILMKNVDYISVRDDEAKKVLSSAVNPSDVKVVPDTVFSISKVMPIDTLNKLFLDTEIPIQRKKYIFFQGNSAISINDRERIAHYLYKLHLKTGMNVLLQPIGFSLGDLEVINEIALFYPDEFIVSSKHLNQFHILSLIANASYYIGTSLHGFIVANSYSVPSLAFNINKYNKTVGFAKLINLENNVCYSTDELFEKFEDITPIQNQQKQYLQERIDEHFSTILKVIFEFRQKKVIEINKVSDCIFENCENQQIQRTKIMQLENEISNKYQEIIQLQREICRKEEEIKIIDKERHDYRIKYEQVVNSIYWKLTKPLKKTVDKLKLLKTK